MARKAETQFRQGQVIPFLKTLKHTKFMAIQQAAIHGDPDYVLCVRGEYIDLELKDEGESPSAIQKFKHSETERCGGRVIVADPSNWNNVKQQLRKLDKGEVE